MSVSRWPDTLTKAQLRRHLALGISAKPKVALHVKEAINKESVIEANKQPEPALSKV